MPARPEPSADLAGREDATGGRVKELQERIFLGREDDPPSGDADLLPEVVDPEVKAGTGRGERPADDRPDARLQLIGVERDRDHVVRSRLERPDPVLRPAEGGHDHHRDRVPARDDRIEKVPPLPLRPVDPEEEEVDVPRAELALYGSDPLRDSDVVAG